MRVENGPFNLPPLRLVQPPSSVTPTGAGGAVESASAASPTSKPATPSDTLSFESIYVKNLPRVPITEAHLRLQRLRQQLVAGQVPGPVHFDSSPTTPTTNPYAIQYLRLAANPADVNARATQNET